MSVVAGTLFLSRWHVETFWGFRGKAPRRGGRKRLALNDKMIGDARLRGHDKKNRGHNTIGQGFDEGESSPPPNYGIITNHCLLPTAYFPPTTFSYF